jgi:hypothetical protein
MLGYSLHAVGDAVTHRRISAITLDRRDHEFAFACDPIKDGQ